MIYVKTDTSGQERISDCRTILLEFDHPPLVKGQWVSNPDSQLIYDEGWREYIPPVIPPAPQDEPSFDEMITAVKRMLSSSVADLTDEQALEVASLYPTWHSMIGKEVAAGQRLWDDEKLWKVLQPHTVSEEWRPAEAVSLYVEVSIAEWPEWRQPTGAHDAYNTGDKVTFEGKHYICQKDGTTFSPAEYPAAWKLVE